ncbi:MAG TPA: hypothetical protein VFS62_08015 [Chloroflexota bacterium]|nr:hypothetical protein [Chloroflexota bacterium]
MLTRRVVDEARRHIRDASAEARLEAFLRDSGCEVLPNPPSLWTRGNADLVRSRKDVAIALAFLEARIELLVSGDRDFTDDGATAPRFHQLVRVVLPARFLRDYLHWSSDQLEAIRFRTWADLGS